jgi:hypothetical protein
MMKKLLLIIALALAVPLVPRETRADIAADDSRDVYTGNGSTTSFVYNFKVLTSANIAVYQANTLKTLTTHYTLTGVNNDAGGTVVFLVAPANGEQVLLLRAQPISQTTSYIDGAISALTIERDFDRQTSVNQQQQEEINRSIKFPRTITPTTGLTELPTPVASKCIGWDGAATALANNDCAGGGGGGLGITTSAGLAGLLTDETGTGLTVFSDSPTLTTKLTVPRIDLTTCQELTGAGSPEGVVAAPVCSTYRRTDGGASTTFYAKETGAGTNTGWVPHGNPAGSGAPTTVPFITTVADGGVSAEFALGSLPTGLLKNTTTIGIPTIAVAGTDYLSPASVLTNSNLPTTITGRTLDNTNTITGWDTLFTLQDNADPTKQMKFELSGYTTATTFTLTPPAANTHLLGGSHFAGTHIGSLRRTGTGTYAACRHNETAITDPTSNDDNTLNYCLGSIWINTVDDGVWHAGDVTTALAVWTKSGVAATPTLTAVLGVGRTDTTATSYATAVKFGGWAFYEDVTLGSTMTCIGVAAVENACNWIRKIAAGFYWELQDSAGTPRFTFTSDTGALTNITLDAEATGNNITMPIVWDLDLVGVAGGTASHVWNDDPLSTACTPLAVTGTNRSTGVCTFPDSDGDYGRGISKLLPTGWTGSLDATVVWKTTGTGNARFQFQTKCYADDEADDAAMNTASIVTAAAGTSARPNMTTITGITTTGCAADELMRIRFFRNRTEGSDTLNASLDVEKVVFKLRATH